MRERDRKTDRRGEIQIILYIFIGQCPTQWVVILKKKKYGQKFVHVMKALLPPKQVTRPPTPTYLPNPDLEGL